MTAQQPSSRRQCWITRGGVISTIAETAGIEDGQGVHRRHSGLEEEDVARLIDDALIAVVGRSGPGGQNLRSLRAARSSG